MTVALGVNVSHFCSDQQNSLQKSRSRRKQTSNVNSAHCKWFLNREKIFIFHTEKYINNICSETLGKDDLSDWLPRKILLHLSVR